MQIIKLRINNFRGIKSVIGDNNIGKTTILEALDLILGPDRLNQYPPIDEHEFLLDETSRILKKKHELTAIVIDYIDPECWLIGGTTLKQLNKNSF
jgi:predicted ATP-dependent endonuclease of OLD family